MRELKEKYAELIQTRQSSRAKKPSVKYSRGSFEIVIPEKLDIEPETVLERHRDWIEDKLPEARKYRQGIPDREFKEGGKISVLGTEREIVIEKRRTGEVTEEKIFLARHLVERNSVKDRVRENLKKYSRKKFEEKSKKFTEEIDGNFEKISVKDQKTRWGSCSGKNNLNFNWRLILGPEKVLEYVVIHELVHLEVRNHSENFWNRVAEIMPDYREAKNWLDENPAKLEF